MPNKAPGTEDLRGVVADQKRRRAPLWIPVLVILGSLVAAWAYATWLG